MGKKKNPWTQTMLSSYFQTWEFAHKQHIVSLIFSFLKLYTLLRMFCTNLPNCRGQNERNYCLFMLYILYLQNASKYITFSPQDPGGGVPF